MTLNMSLFFGGGWGVIYHACTSTPVYKSLASPIPKIWLRQNLKNGSRDFDHYGYLVIPRLALDIFHLQTKFGNARFSFRRSGIWLRASKLKMGHVNLTMPSFRGGLSSLAWIRNSTSDYMSAKFDDYSFRRSRDISGKVGPENWK